MKTLKLQHPMFARTGGAGPSAARFMRRLAAKISDKKEDSHANIKAYIRSFVLFSFILCLCGSRQTKTRTKYSVENSIGAIAEEGRLH